VPSLHFGYSLLVGVTVAMVARRRWVRVVGAAYPPFMLFTIVATGNHFIFDAGAGGIVMVIAYLIARALLNPRAARPAAVPRRRGPADDRRGRRRRRDRLTAIRPCAFVSTLAGSSGPRPSAPASPCWRR
jgi:hypothetical protein